MFPAELPNPFDGNPALKESFAVPAGHVPELHAPVLATIHRMVASARASGSPSSVLVRGEAGSGKTHLLAQLRGELAGDATTIVVGITLFGAYPGGLWRHIRKMIVTDLLRAGPAGAANGLTRILHARYPHWGTEKTSGSSLLDVILGRDAAPKLATFLSGESDLPFALRSVLAKLYDPATATSAADWLKGAQLPDETLAALGLPPLSATDRELEVAAREVVLAVCGLAGEKMVFVLGFDNIEAFQSTLVDEQALRELAWAVAELATGDGARVVVTFVRPETMVPLTRAADKPALQRIAAVEAEIPWLEEWDHVVRLVAARFDAAAAWRNLRKQHADRAWPLGEPFLRGLMKKNSLTLTPRHLIGACRVELERLRKGKEATDAGTKNEIRRDEIIPLRLAPVSFDVPWQTRRDKYIAQPAALTFDTVIGIGLPWLREVVAAPYTGFDHQIDALPDVNLLFRPAGGGPMLGVSFCNHEPTLLWRRLDRLKKQWASGTTGGVLRTLILVRLASTRTAPGGEQRLADHATAGVTVLPLPREQFAELAAYQQIFANVLAGNYTDFGRPVSADEFNTWVKGHLSSAVKELADTVFGLTPGRKTARKTATAKS